MTDWNLLVTGSAPILEPADTLRSVADELDEEDEETQLEIIWALEEVVRGLKAGARMSRDLTKVTYKGEEWPLEDS